MHLADSEFSLYMFVSIYTVLSLCLLRHWCVCVCVSQCVRVDFCTVFAWENLPAVEALRVCCVLMEHLGRSSMCVCVCVRRGNDHLEEILNQTPEMHTLEQDSSCLFRNGNGVSMNTHTHTWMIPRHHSSQTGLYPASKENSGFHGNYINV